VSTIQQFGEDLLCDVEELISGDIDISFAKQGGLRCV